ncbi:MAG: ABC transporter substrate-binding protein [Bacteroidota bacterium]
MQKLTLALDWTPNINHIGFFVAKEKGFYKDVNLEIEIINPSFDNYKTTPAKKVELGMADFALCPTESVISYRTKPKPFPLIAIATILQTDLSAIAVKKDSVIKSPKNLDGKIYSSYKARYEDGIVKEMVRNDGGKGDLKIVYPDKLGIWDTLLKGDADATWIFLNWEGIEVTASDYELTYFKLNDYGIPYSYSPVIAINESLIDNKLIQYQAFLRATKRGFLSCVENPIEAIEILRNELPEKDKGIDLNLALQMTSEHFGNHENWGKIERYNLQRFLDWIKDKGLETIDIGTDSIFIDVCL